jgi:hypothetical protein
LDYWNKISMSQNDKSKYSQLNDIMDCRHNLMGSL